MTAYTMAWLLVRLTLLFAALLECIPTARGVSPVPDPFFNRGEQ